MSLRPLTKVSVLDRARAKAATHDVVSLRRTSLGLFSGSIVLFGEKGERLAAGTYNGPHGIRRSNAVCWIGGIVPIAVVSLARFAAVGRPCCSRITDIIWPIVPIIIHKVE